MKKSVQRSVLTEREKLFCYYYLLTWDVKESARRSGYTMFPERTGYKLLLKQTIKDRLSVLNKEMEEKRLWGVQSGYERLAFGNNTDVIKLMYMKDFDEDFAGELNLFNVAEIKKHKDGSLDIKFFDRFKALDKLYEMSQEKAAQDNTFYKALMDSAKALNNGDDFEV